MAFIYVGEKQRFLGQLHKQMLYCVGYLCKFSGSSSCKILLIFIFYIEQSNMCLRHKSLFRQTRPHASNKSKCPLTTVKSLLI